MGTAIGYRNNGMGVTERTDTWWIAPVAVLLGLLAFVVYSTWAAWQGEYFFWSATANPENFGGYLSPFYSPPLFIKEGMNGIPPLSHALLGPWPDWLWWLPGYSPAWLILVFPLSFRFTCYYYRKAYYRAFAWSPPACAVGAVPQKPYKGESGLLVIQNLHRFAMYFAVIFIFLLSYDAVMSFFNDGVFGVGVGSIVLLINPILLGAYTFGCHSIRHLVGGNMDCFSCSVRAKTSHKAWSLVTVLNERHQLFAWLSLFWVGFSDVYVRLVSMGVITDINSWGV